MRAHLKIAIRNLIKNKTFSVVTIGGLAAAFISFVVILLFVSNELNFDRWHRHPEEVYRVVKDFVNADGSRNPDATTPPALAAALANNLSGVASATRFLPSGGRTYLIQSGEKGFYETSLLRVDSNFFKVLDFPFLRGDPNNPFRGLHSIIITESAAGKYFGNEDPIGQLLRINVNGGTDYAVSAVVRDVPLASHFSFDFLIPLTTTMDITNNWEWSVFYTYVRLKPGTDPAGLSAGVQPLFRKYRPESLDRYYTQALTAIHLKSNLKWELGANSDWSYIRILITIAILILLVAAVNYINLVTAQATRRAKEVGVRKVSGAARGSLIGQFLTESLVIAVSSGLIAVSTASLLLPYTHLVIGYDLSMRMAGATGYVVLASVVLLIGLLAGIYPAFYLSAFRPIRVLKGNYLPGKGGIGLRQSLVVFQFFISTVLIAFFLIISKQLDYIRQKKLGFEAAKVLSLPNVRSNGRFQNDPGSLEDDLRKMPRVSSIGRADGTLASTNSVNGITAGYPANHISLNFMRIDAGFIPTLGITVKEGRNFSLQFAMDSNAIILNETAVRQPGLKPPYIGQQVLWDDDSLHSHRMQLVGVAEDFHFTSLHEAIKPFGFTFEKNNGSAFFLKVSSEASLGSTLAGIQEIWKRHNPDKPFIYTFQSEQVARLYVDDRRFERIFLCLTILAIGIACLGLYGITIYITQSKTKEIGIRKVLGSTVAQILWLLSVRLVRLILVAFVLAAPLAWYLMNRWLDNFAYRTTVSGWVFAATGMLVLAVTLMTVSVQSAKAAMVNPVKSLRAD